MAGISATDLPYLALEHPELGDAKLVGGRFKYRGSGRKFRRRRRGGFGPAGAYAYINAAGRRRLGKLKAMKRILNNVLKSGHHRLLKRRSKDRKQSHYYVGPHLRRRQGRPRY